MAARPRSGSTVRRRPRRCDSPAQVAARLRTALDTIRPLLEALDDDAWNGPSGVPDLTFGRGVLTLRNANAVEGGRPLMLDGKIIGAIGVSGGTPDQDGSVAKVAAETVGKP